MLAIILSVRLSVRPSVTTGYRCKPRSYIDSGFLPYDSVESLVFLCDQTSCDWVRRFPSNKGVKEGYSPKISLFYAINSSSVRTVADRHSLAAYHNKHC